MPVRSVIDKTVYGTKEKAVEIFKLSKDEARLLDVMDKNDQELADYKGCPYVQAQILADRRDANSSTVEIVDTSEYSEQDSNMWGMGLREDEVYPQKNDRTVKLELIAGGVGNVATTQYPSYDTVEGVISSQSA